MSLLVSLLLAVAPASVSAAERQTGGPQECVILLHGFGRTALSMKWIEWELEDHGYTVINPSYPSLSHGIEKLAEDTVGSAIDDCRDAAAGRINFVTHSLGGILVRAYLGANQVSALGRVVMLGPPNQGSDLAQWVASIGMIEELRPPAIDELSKDLDSIPRRLGPVQFDLGVIAGNLNLRPFTPGAPEEPSDGTVAISETLVDGMNDFIELPVTHTFMVWDGEVMRQIIAYLETGRFEHVTDTDTLF